MPLNQWHNARLALGNKNMEIGSISAIGSLEDSSDEPSLKAGDITMAFNHLLREKLSETNSLLNKSDDLATRFARGEKIDVHTVSIAAEEAAIALNLAIEIRNKVVDGYKELLRMQI